MVAHKEGFYRVTVDGFAGVAYCQHNNSIRDEPYETWTTLHLFDRFDNRPHPATSTINNRERAFGRIVVGKRIKV